MFWLPKLQLLLVLRVQLHSGCNCCSQWLQLTFVVKYATLICKLCKYLHESLHHKTAEANNCNSFKYLLQRLQTKFAAFKICNPGCTLDANICSVFTYWDKKIFFGKVQLSFGIENLCKIKVFHKTMNYCYFTTRTRAKRQKL